MSYHMNLPAVLASTGAKDDDASKATYEISGTTPAKIKDVAIPADTWIRGIKPGDFVKEYTSQSFDFGDLCKNFADFCKDFNHDLTESSESKALEFSAKVLFEFGPLMRNEKKGKGDKAIRFRFAYTRPDGTLSIRTVIVSTFKNVARPDLIVDEKLIITMKQAPLLAMVTFCKVSDYAYSKDACVIMTPLCGAIFSKESVVALGEKLAMAPVDVVKTINCSTAPNGHYLPQSDMACAIVAVISATRGMTAKGARDQMINKVIKTYAAQHKVYDVAKFNCFAEHALGGVPQGLDSASLIENFKNIQTSVRLRREPKKDTGGSRKPPSDGGSGPGTSGGPGGPGGSGGREGSSGTGGGGPTYKQQPPQQKEPAGAIRTSMAKSPEKRKIGEATMEPTQIYGAGDASQMVT